MKGLIFISVILGGLVAEARYKASKLDTVTVLSCGGTVEELQGFQMSQKIKGMGFCLGFDPDKVSRCDCDCSGVSLESILKESLRCYVRETPPEVAYDPKVPEEQKESRFDICMTADTDSLNDLGKCLCKCQPKRVATPS